MYFDTTLKRKSEEMANKAPKGLRQIKIGDVVTLSGNKACGDRSYIDGIWQIMDFNDGTVVIKGLHKMHSWSKTNICSVSRYEHEFYEAAHLLPYLQEPKEVSNEENQPEEETTMNAITDQQCEEELRRKRRAEQDAADQATSNTIMQSVLMSSVINDNSSSSPSCSSDSSSSFDSGSCTVDTNSY